MMDHLGLHVKPHLDEWTATDGSLTQRPAARLESPPAPPPMNLSTSHPLVRPFSALPPHCHSANFTLE